MHKELTAVGVSVALNCESSLITEERVVEALGVGIELGGGPATVAARFAMKVLEYYGEGNACIIKAF